MKNVYRNANLREDFSGFVISSVNGVVKPHELMYKTAIERDVEKID